VICILAGNYLEARMWASGQLLEDSEWFFPSDFDDIRTKSNFHVVVVGSAGMNVPNAYFNNLLLLCQQRGRMNRG
jgi:fructose-1-phosphate kinase PfkB-like protein